MDHTDAPLPPSFPPASHRGSAHAPSQHGTIENASAWVLRMGVILSALTMIVGLIFSFVHGTTSISRMENDGFDYHPVRIFEGIAHGHGKSIIELGIYLLVLTPVMRVLTSMILFIFAERDWTYSVITLIVLLLTLAGLVWI